MSIGINTWKVSGFPHSQPHQWFLKKKVSYLIAISKKNLIGQNAFQMSENLCYLIYLMKSESESEVSQSCQTLCNPVDCSPPGFSIHGILQARMLEWVASSFSRGSSRPRVKAASPASPALAGRSFPLSRLGRLY